MQQTDIDNIESQPHKRSQATGIPGVTKMLDRASKPYYVFCNLGKKTVSLGCYETLEEAAAVRRTAEEHRQEGTFAEWYEEFKPKQKQRVKQQRYSAKLPKYDTDGTPIPPPHKRKVGGIYYNKPYYILQVTNEGIETSVGVYYSYKDAVEARMLVDQHLGPQFRPWLEEYRKQLREMRSEKGNKDNSGKEET